MKPYLYKVSQTQWACSRSKNDKHILRCIFGDTAKQAFERLEWNRIDFGVIAIPVPLDWITLKKIDLFQIKNKHGNGSFK